MYDTGGWVKVLWILGRTCAEYFSGSILVSIIRHSGIFNRHRECWKNYLPPFLSWCWLIWCLIVSGTDDYIGSALTVSGPHRSFIIQYMVFWTEFKRILKVLVTTGVHFFLGFYFSRFLILICKNTYTIRRSENFYVLLPYITYVMESGRFSQYPAILSRTAKERDKKYSVKSP